MRRFLILLAALFAAVPATAQVAWRSDAGYVVDLPDGWVPVSDRHLNELRRSLSPENPAGTQVVEAAFQTGGAEYPAPPFAAIARVDFGQRITQEQFSAEFAAPDQALLQRMADSVEGVRARMGVPVWDPENRVAWLRAEMQASGGSATLFAWSAMALHPSGRSMITILYYGPRGQDEREVVAQLTSIVRSLRAD
jgi:hypothetical protein